MNSSIKSTEKLGWFINLGEESLHVGLPHNNGAPDGI